MVIQQVLATVLEGKASSGVRFALGSYDRYSCVLVEVRTDEGLTGHGEAIARRGAAMTRAAVETLLAPVLIGEDSANIEGLWVR